MAKSAKASAAKTVQTTVDPAAFLASLPDGDRKQDAQRLLTWFSEVTGLKPRMWGPTMIGYGRYRYRYESGREGEAMLTGFASRATELVIYILPGHATPEAQARLAKLGPHRTGKSCLYIKRLADVDMEVLGEIVRDGIARMRANYETFHE